MPPVFSTRISNVEYDDSSKTMTVTFAKDGKVYEYYQVEKEVYNGLIAAVSPGRYFDSQVKNVFEFRRLT